MVQDWLNQHIPGYAELGDEEKSAIMNFSLLWSLFEAQVLGNSASARAIQTKINAWANSGLLKTEEFEKHKVYFTQRYIDGGSPNNRFRHLHLRNRDNPELVRRVLKDETNDISEIVSALLIIVWRYRNNFFHGYKWAYGFKGQLNNFINANELLMRTLEIHWHHQSEER
jgi:hypothetical protein